MKRWLSVFLVIAMGIFLSLATTSMAQRRRPRTRDNQREAGRAGPIFPRKSIRPFNIFTRARTLLDPNGPVIVSFDLTPSVFFTENFRKRLLPFLFLPPQGEPQTLEELAVEVSDPDGIDNIAEVRIDLLLPPHMGGFIPRALMLTQDNIIEKDEAANTAWFGLKNLKLRGDLNPMVLIFIANARDKEGHISNMALAAGTIATERTPEEVDVLFPFGEPVETPEGEIIEPGTEEVTPAEETTPEEEVTSTEEGGPPSAETTPEEVSSAPSE